VAGLQPFSRKGIIRGEIFELVPSFVNRIDLGVVGPPKVVLKLQVVWRVSEYEVDGFGGEIGKYLYTITLNDLVKREFHGGTIIYAKRKTRFMICLMNGVNNTYYISFQKAMNLDSNLNKDSSLANARSE
jgi:hypothetical protein